MLVQNYEAGWRAISNYTGAPVHEVRSAARAGDLRRLGLLPVAHRRHLNAWMRRRALAATLAEFRLKFAKLDPEHL